MVEIKLIRETYSLLIEALKKEVNLNAIALDYYNYINDNKEKFNNSYDNLNIEELKQFIIEANRYSDEFCFSDKNRSEIKLLINNIYSYLKNY
ncbi:MAG: hypothetical protein JNK50_10030 [Bacteroidia bacterium]|nr:hypothetical protein [Bacteroidia bacterium]